MKKGYIPWKEEYSCLKEKLKDNAVYQKLFKRIDDKKAEVGLGKREYLLAQVRLFRNYVQGHLIRTAVDSFFKHYDLIMDGKFGLSDLLEKDRKLIHYLKKITSIYCFSCDEVLTLEIVGDRTIKELLDIFYNAIHTSNADIIRDEKKYEGKIYHLISDNYKYIAAFDYDVEKQKELKDINEYEKMHLIVDFISGMTDSYAVSLYKKLLGISLPE